MKLESKYQIAVCAVILLIGFQGGEIYTQVLSSHYQPYNFNLIQVSHALSTPANYLTFQGKLTDASGNPITTIRTNAAFTIYDQLTNGNIVYNETQSFTPDANGIFYIQIGAGTVGSPAGSQTWPPTFSQPYYLAVRPASNGAYLTPRVTLTTGPYAQNRAAAPVETFTSNTNTCTINVLTTLEGGFTTPITYTTSALSSGNIRVGLTFNVQSPATSALTSKWQFIYGTGSAPTCDTTPSGATIVGRQYTIQTQAGAAGSWGQSISIVITSLIPSTTYWFDVQVSDSSTGSWIYSNQAVAISDVLSAVNIFPNLKETDNANTCTHTASATTLMAGLGVTYTTLPSGYGSGNVKVGLSFNLQSPATLADTNKWQIAYGSTATPACNAASTGTPVGKQYTVESQAAAVMQLEQSGSVVIQGLTAGTTYWFDVQSTDLSANQWITSLPTMTINEEANPNGGNVPDNVVYPLSNQTTACVTTTAATSMIGMKEFYTLTSSSTGSIYVSLTFNVLASGTIVAGSTSAWKIAYSDIITTAQPTCASAAAGTTVGQSYTDKTVSTTAFSLAQEERVVITGLLAGHTYWFDLQVTNTGASFTSTYSVPTMAIIDIVKADIPHDNVIFLKNTAGGCIISSSTANLMGGASVTGVSPGAPPLVYQTMSYGTGNVEVTINARVSPSAVTTSSYLYQLVFGTVTDGTINPACGAAATGTVVSQQYNFFNQGTVAEFGSPSITVAINNLSHGTMYWFDLQVTDVSSASATTWGFYQLQVTEAA